MANFDKNSGLGETVPSDSTAPPIPPPTGPKLPKEAPPQSFSVITPPSSVSALFSESFPSPPKQPSSPPPPPSSLTTPSPLPKEPPSFSPVQPEPPPPSEIPPFPERPPLAGVPPPPLPPIQVDESKPLILKFLVPFLILGLLVGGIFAIWKFVLPRLPAQVRPGGVTLTYWGLWEDENILKPLIEEYEKSHRGVKIDYKRQSPKEYRERLQTAITSGKGPDIFRFHNTWVPMLKNDLAPVPSNIFSSGDFQNTFYPVAVADLKRGDSLYGIPLEIDGLALMYNVGIFEAAGVSPPTTWEEFQKIARTLTVLDEKGKIKTSGAALGTTNNVDHWSDILGMMFFQNGVDLKNPKGQLAEDALIYYTSFAQGDNKVWDDTLPPSVLAFSQGKVAMIFAPSWQILTIKTQNPKLRFKVLPALQLPGVNIAWASYWIEGVSAKSQRQAEAWEFVKYLAQKETMVKFYSEAAKTRLFGEPYSRQDLGSSLKNDSYVGAYVNQAPHARSFYLASRTFDNGINDKIIKYLEDALNSINRGVGPRAALETAAQGVQQVLSTYGVPLTP